MAGRKELPEDERKIRLIPFIQKKIIDKLGRKECEKIAVEAVVMEYEKHSSDKTRLLNVENFQKTMSRKMYYITFWIMVGTLVAALYYILEMFSLRVCFCK